MVCRSGIPNRIFIVKQIWIAASLNCYCRQRLPLGGDNQIIPGSRQIESKPRCFSAVLYEGQFMVLYFFGVQLLMPSSYHTVFTGRIPSSDLRN